MGWNVPDEAERWHNQAVEVPEVGTGARGEGLLKLGPRRDAGCGLIAFLVTTL